MEVLMGPTFSIGGDVSSSSSPYVVAPPTTQQEKQHLTAAAARCLFLKDQEDADGDDETSPMSNCLGSGIHPDDSSDSSSIGAPDDSEEDEDEDDDEEDGTVSSKKNNVLGSLNSLEDALPTKRGLSNHFSGKSKSFTNLSEVNTVKELEKTENPFNKRRRILMANKWSRRSFYSWSNPKSMPLLTTLHEDDDDNSDKYHKEADQANKEKKKNPSEEEEEEEALIIGRKKLQERRFHKFGFKSQSCFSLSDLQEEGDEEEGDDP